MSAHRLCIFCVILQGASSELCTQGPCICLADIELDTSSRNFAHTRKAVMFAPRNLLEYVRLQVICCTLTIYSKAGIIDCEGHDSVLISVCLCGRLRAMEEGAVSQNSSIIYKHLVQVYVYAYTSCVDVCLRMCMSPFRPK